MQCCDTRLHQQTGTHAWARRPSRRRHNHCRICTASVQHPLFLGLDFGTGGARAQIIDEQGQLVAEARHKYGRCTDGKAWHQALHALFLALPAEMKACVQSVAVDGTSSTALLIDQATRAFLAPAKMYFEAEGLEAIRAVQGIAPPGHGCGTSTATLTKAMTWHRQGRWQQALREGGSPGFAHHADWLSAFLHGQRGVTDWNSALKLGWEPATQAWPDWLTSQPFAGLLPPRVYQPGAPIAPVTQEAAAWTGLPQHCLVCAGTSDSVAAFLAAGLRRVGEAVTILGSTLAVKLLSARRVDDLALGIYSQRLGDCWLVGGASLSGGSVLLHHFTAEQLLALSPRLQPERPTGLGFYPLLEAGERFPRYDPGKQPVLQPRPEDDAVFLQGMLEGMAAIEAEAYRVIQASGASTLDRVLTAGGGAASAKWTEIRQRVLAPVPVIASPYAESAYGSALLAREGWLQEQGRPGMLVFGAEAAPAAAVGLP